jgi:TATA-box binding protein (TBP) (component of TFIID and TFIIIB)
MELESWIISKNDPKTIAIFEPEEYPGLVWLDIDDSDDMEMLEPDLMPGSPAENVSYAMKTIVFPSGAIVIHGSSMEKMEGGIRKKMPIIQKCIRDAPPAIEALLKPHSGQTTPQPTSLGL